MEAYLRLQQPPKNAAWLNLLENLRQVWMGVYRETAASYFKQNNNG